MQRLAALVPRPRLHLIRFHGALAPNAGMRSAIVPGPPQNTSEPADEHAHGAPARMGWARLLKCVFGIDLEHCPQCGGDLKIIAAIEEAAVIVTILTHLGLPAHAPPRSPARPLTLFQAGRRPDPQDKSGSATGLTIPLGLRSGAAVKVRRREAIRADVELKYALQEENFHQTPSD